MLKTIITIDLPKTVKVSDVMTSELMCIDAIVNLDNYDDLQSQIDSAAFLRVQPMLENGTRGGWTRLRCDRIVCFEECENS